MSKTYFAIKQLAEEPRKAELYIFGDIEKYAFFEGDVSASSIHDQLKGLDVDEIHVHIDSYGGYVSEGWAIYNTLLQHPAKVITYGDGFVASAALFPFLAGDERHASQLSTYFLHRVMVGVTGNSEELRAAADEAERLTEIGIQAFVERAGMDADKVRGLMEQDSWLTPGEALEYGIATSIIGERAEGAQQSARQLVMVRMTAKPQTQTVMDHKDQPQGIMALLGR